MLPEEKRYQGVYNGIASDEGVDLRATERTNRDEEILNMRDAIENLQRRVFELERLNKTIAELDDRLCLVERDVNTLHGSSTGRILSYAGSGDKELNIPVKLDDKGIDFFAGLKDKISSKSDEEEKVLPKSDEDDSAMGRPFCKVVKGKILKQDLSDGVDINKYKFPKLDTYMIDYMHFFRNMHKWDAFDGFEVQLLSSNQPIVGERALLRLGNIDFAIVTIEDSWLKREGISSIVDNIRLIPSFFKLGKIFGAKTYPEFMDAIEVMR